MKRIALLSVLLCSLTVLTNAQEKRFFVPSELKTAYENGTRSYDGKPGDQYWQNTVDYIIEVEVNPETRELTGRTQPLVRRLRRIGRGVDGSAPGGQGASPKAASPGQLAGAIRGISVYTKPDTSPRLRRFLRRIGFGSIIPKKIMSVQ